jgi:tetratricopeptide (TPR) repeat protein
MFAVGFIFPFFASIWINDFVVSEKSKRQETVYADRIKPVKVAAPKPEPISIDLNISDAEIEKLEKSYRLAESEKLRAAALKSFEVSAFQAAESLLTLARKLDPERLDTVNLLGQVSFEQKDYAKAIKLANDALNIEPDDEQSLLLLSRSYYALKDFRLALAAAKLAVNSNPRTFEGYRELGNIYLQLKDNENAVSAFKDHLKISPNDSGVLLKLVRLLKSMDRKEDMNFYFAILKASNPVLADKEFPELRHLKVETEIRATANR